MSFPIGSICLVVIRLYNAGRARSIRLSAREFSDAFGPVCKANYLTHWASAIIIRTMIVTPFRTRLGWVALLADDHALLGLTLPRSTCHAAVTELRTEFNCHPMPGENALTKRARGMLIRYFEGRRVVFDDLPVEQPGTAFQQRVWQLTRAIPYGSTRTYHELACAAGRPRAARAVGQCNARNRLPIIIPCHRLVGSQGDLRGFGGGIPMKRTLLEMEGALCAHRH